MGTIIYVLNFQYTIYESPIAIGVFTSLELLNKAIDMHKANDDVDRQIARHNIYSHVTMELDQEVQPVKSSAPDWYKSGCDDIDFSK